MHADPGAHMTVGVVFFVYLLSTGVVVLIIVGTWRILEKAGNPGWPALVPIYGSVVLFRAVGLPAWWTVPFVVPGVNLLLCLFVSLALARSFGKGNGFALGLWLLPAVFLTVLAFGRAEYQGAPRSSPAGTARPSP